MSHQVAWIDCAYPGCEAGLVVDARHVRNFDGRDWYGRDLEGGAEAA